MSRRDPKPDESAFRHYMRVRIGPKGPLGRLLKCRKREGEGYYWRIRLDSGRFDRPGEWVWPDHRMVLDGPGDRLRRCGDCGLPFLSSGESPLCGYCSSAAFGSTAQRAEPGPVRDPRRWGFAARGKADVKAPQRLSAEDEAAMAEQRRRDQDNTPF